MIIKSRNMMIKSRNMMMKSRNLTTKTGILKVFPPPSKACFDGGGKILKIPAFCHQMQAYRWLLMKK